MTDNEIIKALECCGSLGEHHCDEKCPRLNNGIEKTSYCRRDLIISAYDLIKRQQAEIEAHQKIKAEAIKEFIKMVNRRLNCNTPRGAYLLGIMKEVEKELTEGNNGE